MEPTSRRTAFLDTTGVRELDDVGTNEVVQSVPRPAGGVPAGVFDQLDLNQCVEPAFRLTDRCTQHSGQCPCTELTCRQQTQVGERLGIDVRQRLPAQFETGPDLDAAQAELVESVPFVGEPVDKGLHQPVRLGRAPAGSDAQGQREPAAQLNEPFDLRAFLGRTVRAEDRGQHSLTCVGVEDIESQAVGTRQHRQRRAAGHDDRASRSPRQEREYLGFVRGVVEHDQDALIRRPRPIQRSPVRRMVRNRVAGNTQGAKE